MRRAIALGLLLLTGGATAIAQDEPPAPLPAAEPEREVDEDLELKLAKAASQFLAKAVLRQSLSPDHSPVTSLRIVLGHAKGHRRARQKDGVYVTKTFDTDEAWFAWQRNDEHAASFVEHIALNGKAVTRGLHPPRGSAWLRTGDEPKPTMLTAETHAEDLAELATRRRLVGTLAELFVLGAAIEDGQWEPFLDDVHPGVAFLHRPDAARPGALPYVIWFDKKTYDPGAIRLPPAQDGQPPQDFRLTYRDGRPNVTGDRMRVPHYIVAFDPRAKEGDKPSLELWLKNVSFEALPTETFAARARRKSAEAR